MNILDKFDCDFYAYLNSLAIYQLEMLKRDFWSKPWFENAWNNYRNYVLDEISKCGFIVTLKYPCYIFNPYLKEECNIRRRRCYAPTYIGNDTWKCPSCNTTFVDSKNKKVFERCPNCGVIFCDESL